MINKIEDLELKISKFLRIGVLVSATLLLLGFILQFKLHENIFFVFSRYDYIPFNRQVQFHLYHRHWGVLMSYAGLISLISLPVIRVFLTAFLFIRQKEYLLAGIAIFVLLGLITSFIFGFEL